MVTFDADGFVAFEREGHDRLADRYAAVFAPVTAIAIDRLLDAADVRRNTRVLEIACGPGFVSQAASARGAEPLGVDLAPRMIEKARALWPSLDFQVANVEQLPFPPGTFGALICNFGLGHFPRPELSVSECARVLKEGGRLAFAWWNTVDKQRLQPIFWEAIAAAGAKPPANTPTGHNVFRFSDTTELQRLLEGAALCDVVIEDVTTSVDVPDAAALWDIGLGGLVITASTIAAADTETQTAIRATFDQIANQYRHGSGLRIPISYKIGSARKPPR